MKKIRIGIFLLLLSMTLITLMSVNKVWAAVSPNLGLADTFGILASTYTNTIAGTTINGDLGYTTGPFVAPTVTGSTYIADITYDQAGIDQANSLSDLNSQACTFTFADGAIDLASDITHGLVGVYEPGVYCINGAADIGGGGTITLDGAGTYIFRISGALTTSAGSIVSLNGASPCDVFWTPGAATTLGANSIFKGTVIDDSGVTIGSTVDWEGRALSFNGTVSTASDTITVPICALPSANITLIKTVINNNDGGKLISDFPLFIGTTSVTSGVPITVTPGTYIASETNLAGYTASSWGGDCSSTGSITLLDGDNKVCTITNDDNTPKATSGGGGVVYVRVPPLIAITKVPSPIALPSGPGSVTYNYKVSNVGAVAMRDIKITDDKCSSVNFISGDLNNNNLLDTNEVWSYTCSASITKTTTNIATVVGYDEGGMSATDIAQATVIVGESVMPPLIHVVKKPSRFVLPSSNQLVTYTYTITNPGVVALSNVSIVDDKCAPISFVSGDLNNNKLLEVNESWIYTCSMNIVNSTVNTVRVEGSANGLKALDHAVVTVVVNPSETPTSTSIILPATGNGSDSQKNNWIIFTLIGAIISLSLFFVARKKQII